MTGVLTRAACSLRNSTSAKVLCTCPSLLFLNLPGSRLDSEWLVYPATPADAVPKLDILIRHPKLTMGYFRWGAAVMGLCSAAVMGA